MNNARFILVVHYVDVRWCQCATLGGASVKRKCDEEELTLGKAEAAQCKFQNKKENASAMVNTLFIKFYF